MSQPWEPLDLLLPADQVVEQLRRRVEAGEWLDAFLLAAAAHQLGEDQLHPDPLQLRRAADAVARDGTGAAGMLASAAARALQMPARSDLRAFRDTMSSTAIELAAVVLGLPGPHRVAEALAGIAVPPIGEVMRVPSCFRSFDQHPDDMALLVDRFVRRFGAQAPVCVVGVRTSGSYLAPLCVAALRAHGADAVMLSYRPGRPLRRDERRVVRDVVARGGRVVIVDDPPVSGTALNKTASAVAALGAPEDRIVMLLALVGEQPPHLLRDRTGVYLRWPEWSVHARLREPAVAATLGGLFPAVQDVKVRALAWPGTSGQRGRVRARYEVTFTSPNGGTEHREIAVEGAGLGFFGRHAITVARRLPRHCPRTYGLEDGLLYREWIAAAGAPPDEDRLAEAIVRYVADRGRALRVPVDRAPLLRGRQPAWEIAAGVLSGMFGRLAHVGQVVFLDRIMRGLLRTRRPSVTDGRTGTRFWLGEPLCKVAFDERSFGNLELGCYDEIFDLAGAAADPPSAGFEARLRQRYQRATGRAVDGERWLLYRLAHVWRMRRAEDIDGSHAEVLGSAAVHDYLAQVLDATELDGGGDLCAVDLDGVLETDPLGFPCITPTGVIALRALARHGYRPVIVTGRSLPDAVARCATFGLAGAVAEYGAVVYDRSSDTATDLRDSAARREMDAVRRRLAAVSGLEVDARYEYVLRAWRRAGPPPAAIRAIAGDRVRLVPGDGQVDVVSTGVDKGTGLRHLAAWLSRDPAPHLAVGDSAEDLPMLALARTAWAPGNAAPAVRGVVHRVARRGYQAGFHDACADLLGHRPGSCPVCRPPHVAPRSAALLAVLGLREDGLRGLPLRAARLAVLALRSARW